MSFVNPYSFVPLPKAIARSRPAGHDRARPELLSGRIVVAATALTPLLIRGEQVGTDADHKVYDVPRRGVDPRVPGSGELYVPGSSIHGALRSLHEAMAGGCLRIFDPDFVPVYRQQAKTRAGWCPAVVSVMDREVTVQLCQGGDRDVVHVLVSLLAGDKGQRAEKVRSGACVKFNENAMFKDHGRYLVDSWDADVRFPNGCADAGEWVLHVTDTAARDPRKPCYFMAFRLGTTSLVVCDQVLDEFAVLAAGTNDLRPNVDLEESAFDDRTRVAVRWPPPTGRDPGGDVVGYRDKIDFDKDHHRARLQHGQVVWAKIEDNKVMALSLAQVWRELGAEPAGRRLNDGGKEAVGEASSAAACSDPEHLCISCRIFGAIDATGAAEDDAAAQRAYRGHVRVLDSAISAEAALTTHQLPPLGEPRPGAGQFYLEEPKAVEPKMTGRIPLRQWGSDADHPVVRQIRGRKMYWTLSRVKSEERVDPGKRAKTMSAEAHAFPPGCHLTIKLLFENLSEFELGSLLAALAPQDWCRAWSRVEAGQALGFRLGGGKPLGFGSLRTDIIELALEPSAEKRWLESEPAPADAGHADPGEYLGHFVSDVSSGVREGWGALANLLRVDHVEAALVKYPPAESGDDFSFWKQSQGILLRSRVEPLVPLPDPSETGAKQEINGHRARFLKQNEGRSGQRRSGGQVDHRGNWRTGR